MNPYEVVEAFEQRVAHYAGAKYGVAVESGTAAIFLCLKYMASEGTRVQIPKHTYVSVPCQLKHAGYKYDFIDLDWTGEYTLEPLPIIDSALRFQPHMHEIHTFRCLSFNTYKHIPIGRGGMILHDNSTADRWFRLARHSGRAQDIHGLEGDYCEMVGWEMLMTGEQAARGLELMTRLPRNPCDMVREYPDLSKIPALACL